MTRVAALRLTTFAQGAIRLADEMACHERVALAASRMAEPTGLEPATSRVTGERSNQLNYDSKKNDSLCKRKEGGCKALGGAFRVLLMTCLVPCLTGSTRSAKQAHDKSHVLRYKVGVA